MRGPRIQRTMARARRYVWKSRDAARLPLRRAAEAAGYDVLLRGPTSLVPELPPATDPIWARRSAMPGVELQLEPQMVLIERDLAPYVAEFDGAARAKIDYRTWNGLYQAGDAEILYAMIRHLKPSRMLEIGSGFSTKISAAAICRNARDGHRTHFVAVDPDPRLTLEVDRVDGLDELLRQDCRDLPFERFSALGDGDVLFIDSSHVVKLGSEVNHLILEVLPRLNPGVWVHIHDVHLPYEYPQLAFEHGDLMNEQYLVHAALIGDRSWRIELALSALAREYNERFSKVVPSLQEPVTDLPVPPWLPSAFWLRRAPGDGPTQR